jgi:hypothetical protein
VKNLRILLVLLVAGFFTANVYCQIPLCDSYDSCNAKLPNNGWVHKTLTDVPYPYSSNDCSMTLNYCERQLCDGTIQIQLESITLVGCYPNYYQPGAALEGEIFAASIRYLLIHNDMGVPKRGECKSNIQVVNATCWYQTWGASAPLVFMPCNNSSCCSKTYTICCDSSGIFSIVYATGNSVAEPCDTTNGNYCQNLCDSMPDMGTLGSLNYRKSENLENDNQNSSVQTKNTSYTIPNPANNSVSIILNNTIKGSLVLKITNTEGKELFTVTKAFNNEEAKFVVDLTQLQSGTYFYTMTNNGDKVSDGKFVVVH